MNTRTLSPLRAVLLASAIGLVSACTTIEGSPPTLTGAQIATIVNSPDRTVALTLTVAGSF